MELRNQGKNFDVMHTMYAPDIVSVEPSGEETAGKTPVIQKSEHWQANNTIVGEKVRGPFFNGPNQFAVHFTFDVTPKATGQRITLRRSRCLHGRTITTHHRSSELKQFFYDGRTM